jgi:hypothetical protein
VAVRRILEPAPASSQLSSLLGDRALAFDLSLLDAGRETLVKMGTLHEAVKSALTPVRVRNSDRWVTASKVCARKRPHLFPVRDDVVTSYIGIRQLRSYAADWQVFRGLLEDDRLMTRLRKSVDEAAAEDDVQVGDPNALLRHLDVVLWMHASEALRSSPPEG